MFALISVSFNRLNNFLHLVGLLGLGAYNCQEQSIQRSLIPWLMYYLFSSLCRRIRNNYCIFVLCLFSADTTMHAHYTQSTFRTKHRTKTTEPDFKCRSRCAEVDSSPATQLMLKCIKAIIRTDQRLSKFSSSNWISCLGLQAKHLSYMWISYSLVMFNRLFIYFIWVGFNVSTNQRADYFSAL